MHAYILHRPTEEFLCLKHSKCLPYRKPLPACYTSKQCKGASFWPGLNLLYQNSYAGMFSVQAQETNMHLCIHDPSLVLLNFSAAYKAEAHHSDSLL